MIPSICLETVSKFGKLELSSRCPCFAGGHFGRRAINSRWGHYSHIRYAALAIVRSRPRGAPNYSQALPRWAIATSGFSARVWMKNMPLAPNDGAEEYFDLPILMRFEVRYEISMWTSRRWREQSRLSKSFLIFRDATSITPNHFPGSSTRSLIRIARSLALRWTKVFPSVSTVWKKSRSAIVIGSGGAVYTQVERAPRQYASIVFAPEIEGRGWPRSGAAFKIVETSASAHHALRELTLRVTSLSFESVDPLEFADSFGCDQGVACWPPSIAPSQTR